MDSTSSVVQLWFSRVEANLRQLPLPSALPHAPTRSAVAGVPVDEEVTLLSSLPPPTLSEYPPSQHICVKMSWAEFRRVASRDPKPRDNKTSASHDAGLDDAPPPPPPPPRPTVVKLTTELKSDSSTRLSRPESLGTSLGGAGGGSIINAPLVSNPGCDGGCGVDCGCGNCVGAKAWLGWAGAF